MRVIDFQNAECKHCYKCVRNCKVKAISVKNEQAHIIPELCIHCGHCLEVCPQNAKTFASDMDIVQGFLYQSLHTVISIAPSYLGVMEYEKPGQVVDALQKLGFSQVRETAEGAAYVTQEYKKLLEAGTMKNIITTCCPSANDLIEKYYPELTPYMAPVVSPVAAHGRLIKKMYGPDTRVIFLGPCIAKKSETQGDTRVEGAVDAILTFEEVDRWLSVKGIRIKDCEEKPMGNPDPNVNRLYPVSGGIIKSVLADCTENRYQKLYVDGLDACMQLFDSMKEGRIENCFLEVNICEGGCIKGPASGNWNHSFVMGKLNVEREVLHRGNAAWNKERIPMNKQFGNRRIKEKEPSEEELVQLLRAIGKYTKEDELNCGACGYSSCREKAKAVYQKKAELEMCLPYAVAKAESMANVVMDATPNLVFIVDREFLIRECNKKTQEVLELSREEILERYIFEFVDEKDINGVFLRKQSVIHKKINLDILGMTVIEILIYIEEQDSVLVIYQDVTKEERAKEIRVRQKMETMEMAQEVIDKQMMVAQEIAGLLGETTAETKVTLTKLRDSVLFEEEEM